MMKKTLVIVLACILVVLMAACSTLPTATQSSAPASSQAAASPLPSQSAASASEQAAAAASAIEAATASNSGDIKQTGTGKTVGVASQHLQNQFNVYLSDGIKKYLQDRGYTVNHTNAMGQTAQQVKDVENFVASGVNGIIIAGGEGDAFKEVTLKAQQAGIPVVGVDMFLEGAIAGVSADNFSGGAAMGMFLATHMNEEGKVILLTTPGWASIAARDTTGVAVLNQFPKIKVLNTYEVTVNDPIGESYNIVKSVLQSNPDLKGIFCGWGQPTIGALQAVEEAGLNKQITIVGADADDNVLQAMAKPGAPMWGQMGQDPGLMGQRAAYLLDQYFQKATIPKTMYGPTYFATNGDPNLDLSVVKYNDVNAQWAASFPDVKKPW